MCSKYNLIRSVVVGSNFLRGVFIEARSSAALLLIGQLVFQFWLVYFLHSRALPISVYFILNHSYLVFVTQINPWFYGRARVGGIHSYFFGVAVRSLWHFVALDEHSICWARCSVRVTMHLSTSGACGGHTYLFLKATPLAAITK